MNDYNLTKPVLPVMGSGMRWIRIGALTFAALPLLAGCVSVEAPTEPIVINLNIKVEQEVVYRLNDEARALIEEESEIF